ncbi:MAG: LuxR C-terminal-related transcriptional regulator [Anaerolineae bacterium]
MARSTPVARGTRLSYQTAEGSSETVVVGTSDWYDWLNEPAHRHFAFQGRAGRFTARKERRQRGGWYWTAYRQIAGKLHKAYLGKSEDLSLKRLEEVASALLDRQVQPAPDASRTPSPRLDAAGGAQSPQVLVTKIFVPFPPTGLVSRPRLIARLNEGLRGKVTLVSAPAGFGKTTLVSEWVAVCRRPTAWLSLDEGDSDPARFLTYLVAALQTIAPNVGAGMLSMMQSAQPPPTEVMLTALLNDISTLPDHFLLVLDDYHAIDAKPVDQALTFLVEHLPRLMGLVIATREDPQLPLARLRARGQLTELRAADLRFTPAEAAEFLNRVMSLNLSAEDIAVLEDRTEGWIAGLQIAALSMRGREDIPGFIRAFAGDHRYILDYLIEEVLQRQPETVRSFLLQTAILDRLNGSLCDAVTGQERGQSQLEALERGNFFVVSLDEKRDWYRYHHLFADVLQARLVAEQPGQASTLHRRASEWYERNGSSVDAIRHALAAADFERAAGLVERAVTAMRRSIQEATVLGWLKALPDTLLQVRPVLSAVYAGALLATGELNGVEARLQDAERWLDTPADRREMVVVDEEAFRRLPGSIAVWRAGQALMRGDVDGTVKYARQALDLVPEDEHLERGGAEGLLGLAAWMSGDLQTAYRTFAEGMAHLEKAGFVADAVNGAIALADIRTGQGRLRDAMRVYQQALRLAAAQGEPGVPGMDGIYIGMSELYREQNDLDAALQCLRRSKELSERTAFPRNRHRWYVAMAAVQQINGNLDAALDLLDEAERLYMSDFFPNVRPIAAFKARLWVAQGRVDEALHWAHAQALSPHDKLNYLREAEHITLARVLLALARSNLADSPMYEGLELLERLLTAAEQGARTGSIIEILVLQALAHQLRGDLSAAVTSLKRALALAEPEGYVRMFVDEGPPMAALLEQAAKLGIAPKYVRHLLAAIGRVEDGRSVQHGLVEPLSERELEVLRLLRTELTGPDIARQLMVSVNTLRTHTKNIYDKLEVNSRRAAVRRAEELDLL